jgi:hypothetical protein
MKLTEEAGAAVAAHYPGLTPALVRQVGGAPPSTGDDWQELPDAAPVWQIADGVMVAVWRE